MSTTLQFRRGNNSVSTTTTGALGELFINTDNNTIAVHDGSTVGGWPLVSNAYNFGVNATQNTSISAAFSVANNTVYLQGALNTANASITYLQGGLNSANANISALQVLSSTYGLPNINLAYNQANSANILAQAAFNTANTAAANTIYLQNGLNTANANTTSLSANISMILGIDASQNSTISAVSSVANASLILAQAAFNEANTYISLPQTLTNLTANNYVLQFTDQGGHIYINTSNVVNIYIPNNGVVTWPVGTFITIVSHQTANLIVGGTGVSLWLAANTVSNVTRNVVSYGVATLLNTAANNWYIYGFGVV
jgi:hypothetical protein